MSGEVTTEDLYRAPTVDEPSAVPAAAHTNGQFYVVGRTKFFVLYFSTFSLYGTAWFFQHWSHIRRARSERVSALWRSLFSIFFVHGLFERFDAALKAKFLPVARPNATVFVVLTILTYVTGRVTKQSDDFSAWDGLSTMLMFACAWPLWSAQKVANEAAEDPQGESNSSFTMKNYAWCLASLAAFGLLVWLGMQAEMEGVE